MAVYWPTLGAASANAMAIHPKSLDYMRRVLHRTLERITDTEFFVGFPTSLANAYYKGEPPQDVAPIPWLWNL